MITSIKKLENVRWMLYFYVRKMRTGDIGEFFPHTFEETH